MCPDCGQSPIHAGGIGCQCGKCRCGLTADETGFCFLCRPCRMHGRQLQMHTEGMMAECQKERTKK